MEVQQKVKTLSGQSEKLHSFEGAAAFLSKAHFF